MNIINDTFENTHIIFEQILPLFERYYNYMDDIDDDLSTRTHKIFKDEVDAESLNIYSIYKLMFLLNHANDEEDQRNLYVYAKLINITRDSTRLFTPADGIGRQIIPNRIVLEFEKLNITRNNVFPLNKFKIYVNLIYIVQERNKLFWNRFIIYNTQPAYTDWENMFEDLILMYSELYPDSRFRFNGNTVNDKLSVHIFPISVEEILGDKELSLITTQKLYMTTKLLTEGLQKFITNDDIIGVILEYFTHSSNYKHLLDKQLFEYVHKIISRDLKPVGLESVDMLNIIESSPYLDSILAYKPVLLSLYNILKLFIKIDLVEPEERRVIKKNIEIEIVDLFKTNPEIKSALVQIINSGETLQTKLNMIKEFLLDVLSNQQLPISQKKLSKEKAKVELMGPDELLNKYLKYKSKYIKLKNSIISLY